eukprot:CAMPEP_0204899088 /NCGR_PEP_ID=MMETSP1397-20131031/1653_1 /ASSEMBLY_ACC=CAM_ASM_000891 /TAXON_ID=49980 /ORGANISM="Climacostomum Climacostomum virens, Strain Stock W-24" /LENGTH=83 /DNA_ID=CAMNT_0052067003 /DNA_START=88 /DNA_END=339 /DNA_ORIENTATION=+
MITRRVPVFDIHIQHVIAYQPRGLLLAGGTTDPYDGAYLIWKGSADVIEEFVKADPFFTEGLITSYSITKFDAALGEVAHYFS